MKMALSKTQKALLIWSVSFLILAEVIKHLHVESRAATKIGLIEVVIAILTGIAFGVVASTNKER